MASKHGISDKTFFRDNHMLTAPEKVRERFWKRVVKTDSCWMMTRESKQYGTFYFDGVTMNAHRVAKLWATGEAPGPLFCCHQCQNKGCVNPKHTYWGTPRENVLDRLRDGTDNRGRKNVLSVIDERMAAHIWEEYRRRDITQQELSSEINVNVAIVASVIKKQSWSHVTESLIPMPHDRRQFSMQRGEDHHNARLTIRQVAAIKRLLAAGCKQIDISEAAQIHKTIIQGIASERGWAHLDHLDRRMLESLEHCSTPQF